MARCKRSKGLKDKNYLGFIAELPCVVCILPWRMEKSALCYSNVQSSKSEVAHVGQRGLSQKCSDRETIPLCAEHHRTGKDAHHVLGKKFWQHHGISAELLIAELNKRYEEQK